MSIAAWSLFIGLVLISMLLAGNLITRLPMSTAIVYLGVGFALGPAGLGLVAADPIRHADLLEHLSEAAVLISLFAVGLKLGVPIADRRWWLPLSLAFPSMAITVGLIAALGVFGLGLPLGAAVLLGGILAPTDPVLASGIQGEGVPSGDQVRFSLAGEGALNDGTAFPFVLLGLGLLGLHPVGADFGRWLLIDLLWATAGGLLIGGLLGGLIGKFVVHLRTRHQNAVGLDEFLSLGLIAVAYGLSQLCLASGFLAVFAAGMALNRVRDWPLAGTTASDERGGETPARQDWRLHSHHASSAMTRAVLSFIEQLEKLAEMAIVLLVGALLYYARPGDLPWWFVPLLFLLVRPLAVATIVVGHAVPPRQCAILCWFGIRGIGSLYYLMYALNHGIGGELAGHLTTLTLVTIAASILLHGVSARPLMHWYTRRSRQAGA